MSRRVGPCRAGLAVTTRRVDRAAALGCAPSSDRGLGRGRILRHDRKLVEPTVWLALCVR